MKLEKEASSAATVDAKDKLAALREKRRLREAGTTSSSTSASVSSAPSPISAPAAAPAVIAATTAAATTTTAAAVADSASPPPSPLAPARPTAAAAVASPVETPSKSESLKSISTESIENSPEVTARPESRIGTGASPSSVSSSTKDPVEKVSTDGVKRGGDTYQLKPTATFDESDAKIHELTLKVSELSAALDTAGREKVVKQKEIVTLNDLTKSLLQQLNKSQEEKDKAHEKTLEANKIILSKTNAAADMKRREGELEAQVNELMDTLEILTLDKEQLVMENELLQAQIDESRLQGTLNEHTDDLLLAFKQFTLISLLDQQDTSTSESHYLYSINLLKEDNQNQCILKSLFADEIIQGMRGLPGRPRSLRKMQSFEKLFEDCIFNQPLTRVN